jgi:hypothetical protein
MCLPRLPILAPKFTTLASFHASQQLRAPHLGDLDRQCLVRLSYVQPGWMQRLSGHGTHRLEVPQDGDHE